MERNSAIMRPGDWLTIAVGLALIIWLFATLWHHESAGKIRIRTGAKIFAELSLDQTRTLDVPGPLGNSHVVIDHGQVRFASSPCRNQYCVHQGWMKHAGQVAVCLPNQVSVELLGAKKGYDSINY